MITELDLPSLPGKVVDTSTEEEGEVEYTQEQYLKFAQSRRVGFIQAVEKACETPEGLATLDPDRQSNYLAAIRDIEKQVLVLRKLEQDKQNNDQTNAAIAAFILEQAKSRNVEASRTKPVIPDISLIPEKPLIEGETVIGDQIENYREYKQRTGHLGSQDPAEEL